MGSLRIAAGVASTILCALIVAASAQAAVETGPLAEIQANQAPTAVACCELQYDEGPYRAGRAYVFLNGNHSTDPDGDPLAYHWTQIAGPATAVVRGADSSSMSFLGPVEGDYTFELEACDPEPLCDTDTITIPIAPPNDPPVASAGPDQTVESGATVTFDGTGSFDPDGDTPLSYSWVQTGGPRVTLTGERTATPSFTAPGGPATLTFLVEVGDWTSAIEGEWGHDRVTVYVDPSPPPNYVPTADAGPGQTVDLGSGVGLDATGSSDRDGDPLDYHWEQTGGQLVSLSSANTATTSFTAPVTPTTLRFQVDVCDQEGCDMDVVVINVEAPAPAPVIDAGGDVIVNGPTSSKKHSKTFVVQARNLGARPLTVSSADVAAQVTVNGAPDGAVAPTKRGSKTLKPGARTKFKLEWSYTSLAKGASVVYEGCVDVTSDVNAGNDCGSATVTAR